MTKRAMATLLMTGGLLLILLAAACTTAPAPQPTAVPPSPTPLSLVGSSSGAPAAPTAAPSGGQPVAGSGELTGAALFQLSCASCHGQDRGGNTFDQDGQKIDVPALSWDDLSSTYASDPGRGSVADQIALAITKGQDEAGDQLEPMMPLWSSLSKAQVSSLIDYLQSPGSANVASASAAAASVQGEQLYQAACVACHGKDRGGNTFDQDGQKIEVPALSWDDLSSTYSSDPSRGSVPDQLALAITKGQAEDGTDLESMMPRWSSLTKAQVDSLIAYLQGGTASAPAEPTGATLYQLSCAACHGKDLAGNTFDQDGQKIEVPALAWDDLSSTYASDPSRGSVSDQIALAITKGQDEAGDQLEPMMPLWSSLSQAQVNSLVDYIQAASAGSAPAPEATDLQGEQLYQSACAACHGADGAGKTFEIDGNKISTPALSWADLSSTYASDPSRGTVSQQIGLAITKGQDEAGDELEPMMPRWSFLSQAQVDSLVQYIQTAFK